MKYFTATAVVLFSIFTASLLGAQKLYTWTDESGVLHITDHPPPQKAQLEEVVTYKERTPEEQNAIERRKNKLRRELEQELPLLRPPRQRPWQRRKSLHLRLPV